MFKNSLSFTIHYRDSHVKYSTNWGHTQRLVLSVTKLVFLTVIWGKDDFHINARCTQTPFSTNSDAVWQREVLLLPVSDQRPAVDLAADPLLHHLPPVELQARVHHVHTLGGQVREGWGRVCEPNSSVTAQPPQGDPASEAQAQGWNSSAEPWLYAAGTRTITRAQPFPECSGRPL